MHAPSSRARSAHTPRPIRPELLPSAPHRRASRVPGYTAPSSTLHSGADLRNTSAAIRRPGPSSPPPTYVGRPLTAPPRVRRPAPLLSPRHHVPPVPSTSVTADTTTRSAAARCAATFPFPSPSAPAAAPSTFLPFVSPCSATGQHHTLRRRGPHTHHADSPVIPAPSPFHPKHHPPPLIRTPAAPQCHLHPRASRPRKPRRPPSRSTTLSDTPAASSTPESPEPRRAPSPLHRRDRYRLPSIPIPHRPVIHWPADPSRTLPVPIPSFASSNSIPFIAPLSLIGFRCVGVAGVVCGGCVAMCGL